jgi:hypothetical protein
MEIWKLFAALKKIREFEKQRPPFIKALVDFDSIIEIGHAQEQKKVFTAKQIFPWKVGSVTTDAADWQG